LYASAANGTISFLSGAQLNATVNTGTTGGNLIIAAGVSPTSALTAGSAPAGFSDDEANGGQIFWGPAGVLTSTAGGNIVSSIGGQVAFLGVNAGAITAAGNVTIHSQTPSIV